LIDKGICTCGGTRSSAQDLLDIMCNSVDAYVDLRALFSSGAESRDEVLHIWDVGGVLPVLDGLGFLIADARQLGSCRTWQSCNCWDPMALVVARPSAGHEIVEIVRSLPFVVGQPDGEETVSFKKSI